MSTKPQRQVRFARRMSITLAAWSWVPAVLAQGTSDPEVPYSVEWTGPLIGQSNTAISSAITEGDLLQPPGGVPMVGPLPNPEIVIPAQVMGFPTFNCPNPMPGVGCKIEIDALSGGQDYPMSDPNFGPVAPREPGRVVFSVDEWALGIPISPMVPNLRSEAMLGEAAADVFTYPNALVGPLPPFAVPILNVQVYDGDGLNPAGGGQARRGLGMTEPSTPGMVPDTGDNLDAMDLGTPTSPLAPFYFSVDSGFLDPIAQPTLFNSGSAQAQGFEPGGILRSNAAGSIQVWAQAMQLGLDLAGPPGSDDLDALAIWDNGNGFFDPSSGPYEWQTGATDMVLFSVRRGSAVIGMPDSIFGLPIEPGDILIPPVMQPGMIGPPSPFPGIFIAAENLGLRTARSSGGMLTFGDDLDALDTAMASIVDCNGNGIDDAFDISSGFSSDVNGNGVPDECEAIVTSYCDCASSGPCGNDATGTGCENSTSVGALLQVGSGTTSVILDDLVLDASGLPPSQFVLTFMGAGMISLPFGDGLRCVGAGGAGIFRFSPPTASTAGGFHETGPGLVAFSQANFLAAGWISVGQTWNFQSWYRDPFGPCGSGFNLSNGLSTLWTL